MPRKRKILLILNSPTIGGAERSALIQSTDMSKDWDITIAYPDLGIQLDPNIVEEFNEFKFIKFHYPTQLYQISRTKGRTGLLKKISASFLFAKLLWDLNLVINGSYEYVWANGNKVGVPLLFYLLIFPKTVKMCFWHIRDYPEQGIFWKIISLLIRPTKGKLQFLCNSISVSKRIEALTACYAPVHILYNPCGLKNYPKARSAIKTLGVVSMFTPWKGIHQIIVWAKIYEEELKLIGIEKIKVFGGAIYQTQTTDKEYFEQCHQLVKKLGVTIISFEGLKRPEEIFTEIDLLIHPVLRPEPFGRVILESYHSHVPVISTRLGGANEVVINHQDATFLPYDYAGLMEKVAHLLKDRNAYLNHLELMKAKVQDLDQSYREGLRKVFI